MFTRAPRVFDPPVARMARRDFRSFSRPTKQILTGNAERWEDRKTQDVNSKEEETGFAFFFRYQFKGSFMFLGSFFFQHFFFGI